MKRKKTSEWRLQQCRTNQRRYRKQAVEDMRNLEENVANLTVETARLEGNLHILRSTALMPSAAANMIAEYTEYFRHGLSQRHEARQIDMVRRIVTEDAIVGGFDHGASYVIDQWRKYSTYFHALEIVQTSMEAIDVDFGQLVHCHGYFLCRITRQTFQDVFPHVLNREDLVQRLLGQELKVVFSRQFTVEKESNRIVHILTSADFMNSLMALLQSTEDAIAVMDGALLDSAGQLQGHGDVKTEMDL
ncbi:unnamed protein product [Aphanomyces euteiches]